jgi:pheromone shutdown-related protein TraB
VDTAPAADSENVTRILYQDKEILLIGTAHVSQDSVALVRAVIEQEKPDSVCIELDADRYNSLKNPGNWEKTDVVQVIKKKKTGFLLASLALSSYQKRMAKQLNTKVGGEMIQGMESAEAIGAELVLADRSIQTTFLRIWRKLNAWDKAKLMMNLFFSFDEDTELTEQDLQDLLGADMLESALNDVRKEFPRIGEILISERDQHLAAKIKEAPGKKIVAVLGGAHIPGVVKEIPLTQNLDEISVVPDKGIGAEKSSAGPFRPSFWA